VSWHYSRALAEAYWEATCSAGARSAPSSGTPTPQAFLSPDRMTEFSRLSRFGMTCAALTDDHGAALLTWYRAGFPARTFQPPDAGQASTANAAAYGGKWPGLLARYSPITHSWKTPQGLLWQDLEQSLETWPHWGSMRNGECWKRPMLALPTVEPDSGYWPTPNALPASNSLALQCSGDGRRKPNKLGWAVAQRGWLGAQAPGIVNPEFAEWLMGWPLGWTAYAPLATDRFRSWQRLHGGC